MTADDFKNCGFRILNENIVIIKINKDREKLQCVVEGYLARYSINCSQIILRNRDHSK
jgi:hypothetical protein